MGAVEILKLDFARWTRHVRLRPRYGVSHQDQKRSRDDEIGGSDAYGVSIH